MAWAEAIGAFLSPGARLGTDMVFEGLCHEGGREENVHEKVHGTNHSCIQYFLAIGRLLSSRACVPQRQRPTVSR